MRLRKEWGEIKPAGSAAGSQRSVGAGRTSGATAGINRQIRSLAPGQTIRGEVVSRNGNEVQIRLADDTVIQAKVDQNMNLEVGKNMTFEVRNNGSALTLSPLFENVSADVNVLKALDMAGLPVNEISVDMTSQLMKAGLPVDRNSLQQVYRELASFPQAQIEDVVALHKLGLEVNETNINQMISYRNLTHQLVDGIETVLGMLPEAMEGMLAEGNLQGLSGLYQELFGMLGEGSMPGGQSVMDGSVINPQEAEGVVLQSTASVGGTPESAAGILLEELAVSGDNGEGAADAADTITLAAQESGVRGANLTADTRAFLAQQILDLFPMLPLSQEETAEMSEQLRQFADGQLGAEQFFAMAAKLIGKVQTVDGGIQAMHQIFSGGEFREMMEGQIKNLWMLRPEELDTPGKVEELYRRMDRQLRGLAQALETGGQAESGVFRAAVSMSQNIDFLNQLNQMYTYVQLPLLMREGEAHGELYVYTNKRGLAAKEGKISALLHLDMEHLGPLDVYVVLEQSKVNTRFYVQDDEMLDFLSDHMDILTGRLAKRGYDCNFSMTTRGEGQEENSGVGPILGQEKGVMLSQYAFDMRA